MFISQKGDLNSHDRELQDFSPWDPSIKCISCNKNPETMTEKFYKCLNCSKWFCPKCEYIHKIETKHKIIHQSEINSYCNEHFEKNTHFCKKCTKNICKNCIEYHREKCGKNKILKLEECDIGKIEINKITNKINETLKIIEEIRLMKNKLKLKCDAPDYLEEEFEKYLNSQNGLIGILQNMIKQVSIQKEKGIFSHEILDGIRSFKFYDIKVPNIDIDDNTKIKYNMKKLLEYFWNPENLIIKAEIIKKEIEPEEEENIEKIQQEMVKKSLKELPITDKEKAMKLMKENFSQEKLNSLLKEFPINNEFIIKEPNYNKVQGFLPISENSQYIGEFYINKNFKVGKMQNFNSKENPPLITGRGILKRDYVTFYGYFKDSKPIKGKAEFNDGGKYYGDFLNDDYKYYGKYINKKGLKYDINFIFLINHYEYGKFGIAKIYYSFGTYDGVIYKLKPHGEGEILYKSGRVWKGIFKNGFPNDINEKKNFYEEQIKYLSENNNNNNNNNNDIDDNESDITSVSSDDNCPLIKDVICDMKKKKKKKRNRNYEKKKLKKIEKLKGKINEIDISQKFENLFKEFPENSYYKLNKEGYKYSIASCTLSNNIKYTGEIYIYKGENEEENKEKYPNLISGRGIMEFEKYTFYGYFYDNKPIEGRAIFKDGSVYIGSFNNLSDLNYYGKYIRNGIEYEINACFLIIDDIPLPQKKAKIHYNFGLFEGYILNFKPYYGKFTFNDGSIYNGNYDENGYPIEDNEKREKYINEWKKYYDK